MSLSEDLKKIFASQKTRAGQAGQAVVEYILVLVVTVSIILGILYQFNDAFKSFLDSYFGDYIACLLETGELPSLGGDGPTAGECNAGFENFNIASGRPSKDSGGGGSGGDSSGNNGSGSGGSDGSSGSSGSSGRPSAFRSGGGQVNAEYSSGALGNNNRPPRQELQADRTPPEAAPSESSDSTGGIRQSRRVIRRRGSTIADEFIIQSAKRKKNEKVILADKPKKQRALAALRKAKFSFTPPDNKVAPPSLEIGGFSLARILKFMLILGIIIAIGIFLGGQLLQIKKSWQKSE